MRVLDASSGVFAVHPGERDGFRSYLAKHGIACDGFGYSAAKWPEGDSGKAGQPDAVQLKLIHPDEMEKAEGLYHTWRTNQP